MTPLAQAQRYYRVYVWQFPVRFFHWTNALCITVLGITGYFIGHPTSLGSMAEAYQQYWFGYIRLLHFATGYVFTFNMLFRIYWGFVGNRHARWDQFIPFRPEQFREIVEVLKVDVLQTRVHGIVSIGHNMLAGFIYFLTFFVFMFQVVTGFGLYAAMSDAWFAQLFAWVPAFMGSDIIVRQWHHVMLWFYVVFTLIHVYLVFYHDYVEGRGTTSSMVGGWKFERDVELRGR